MVFKTREKGGEFDGGRRTLEERGTRKERGCEGQKVRVRVEGQRKNGGGETGILGGVWFAELQHKEMELGPGTLGRNFS